jgi:hypothetical protein
MDMCDMCVGELLCWPFITTAHWLLFAGWPLNQILDWYRVEASEIVDAVRLALRFYGEKGRFPSYPIYTKWAWNLEPPSMSWGCEPDQSSSPPGTTLITCAWQAVPIAAGATARRATEATPGAATAAEARRTRQHQRRSRRHHQPWWIC